MKLFISFLSLFFILFHNVESYSQNIGTVSGLGGRLSSNIENGWYSAKVIYSNSYNYTKSTYKLRVKVEYDIVTEIDFGNGGSVHSGYNASGYFYSGGTLIIYKDNKGDISSATTKVTVMEDSKYRYFDISIE